MLHCKWKGLKPQGPQYSVPGPMHMNMQNFLWYMLELGSLRVKSYSTSHMSHANKFVIPTCLAPPCDPMRVSCPRPASYPGSPPCSPHIACPACIHLAAAKLETVWAPPCSQLVVSPQLAHTHLAGISWQQWLAVSKCGSCCSQLLGSQ